MTELVPLVGEPLALDLLNTRAHSGDGLIDLIATPDGLRAWLALEANRLPGITAQETATLGENDLAPIHAVRQHVACAIDNIRNNVAPPIVALQGLNRALHTAPAIPELVWDGTAVAILSRRCGSLGMRIAAQLAEAAAELLASPAVTSVRKCEAEDCVMLFLPAHPRRRWCSAERCGNRVRVARYYRRHKALQA